jgi:uncharacterized protein YdhG (YjbR/CyaY superfamily)
VTRQFATVDEYIGSFPEDVRDVLGKIRQTIRNAAPAAGERISYQIPAFTIDGRDLVYVAAWKKHISVYPASVADEALQRELAPYLTEKATLKFPLGKPIPYELIDRLVTLRLAERLDSGEGQ